MKAVFLLGAFALALVAGLEESENKNVASLTQILLRDTREARKGNNNGRKGLKGGKKKKRSGKNKTRSGKKKKRSSGKKKRSNKKKKRSNKKKKRSDKKKTRKGKKKRSQKKTRGNKSKNPNNKPNLRQDRATCDMTQADNAFAQFVRNENARRKAKRIASFINTMDSKTAKAATAFTNATEALKKATNDGTSCADPALRDPAVAAYNLLKDCPTTAAAACDTSGLPVTITQVEACSNKNDGGKGNGILDLYFNDIKTCIGNLPLTTCTDQCGDVIKKISEASTSVKDCWTLAIDNEAAVKTAKKDCANNGGPSGSFFNCMKAVKESPILVAGCSGVGSETTMTTAAPGRRILQLKQLFK